MELFPKSSLVEANISSAEAGNVAEFRASPFDVGEVIFIVGFAACSSDLSLVSVVLLST